MRYPLFHSFVALLGFALIVSVHCDAQFIDPSQSIEMEADTTGADARTGALTFTNISIRQGRLEISAQSAESSALGFDDSKWTFTGAVKIVDPTVELNAQSMLLEFNDGNLTTARLQGAPLRYASRNGDNTDVSARTAQVEFADNRIRTVNLDGQPIEISRFNAQTGKTTSGRAESIGYDATSQDLQLSGSAELNEDGNVITGSRITYNIGEQTVLAAGGEQSDERVHITINPKSGDDDAPEDATTPAQADDTETADPQP